MQMEQFKILRAARATGTKGFTKPELIERANIGRAALDSVFRRNGERFFERTGEKRAGTHGGNRTDVWRLRPDALTEIDDLLDADRAAQSRDDIDPIAAKAALQDDHARWQARVSLFDAVDAGKGPSRDRHLQRCWKWVKHEERRLKHLGAAGVTIPVEVTEELEDLQRRRSAVQWNIDRLAALHPMETIREAFEWIYREARRYNEGDPDAFAPLRLADHDAPHEVLAEAALLCAEFDGCPRERFIIGTIIALPSIGKGRARNLLCGMLDVLGDIVGYSLVVGIDQARQSERREALDFVPAVLIGFQSHPQLLKRSRFASVRRWYDSLPWNPEWDVMWSPLWAELGHHTLKNAATVRRRLHANQTDLAPPSRSIVDDLRGIVGAAYDKVYAKLDQQIEHYYTPPQAPAGGDWLRYHH